MLANLFLALLVIGAVMMGVGFVEALRTGGKGAWFVPVLVGLVIVILGAVLRVYAV